MDIVIISLLLLLFAVLASTLAAKINVPEEIFLLLASIGVSFIPGLSPIKLEPHTIFFIFLPPLLFYAAFFTSWRDFLANKRPITLLAVGLVLFTMCAVAVTLKYIIPSMPWALCFLFGAIVSPTDASSAVPLVKKLGIPRRLSTIIEGESLINDATALIAYRYALAAMITGAFSFWHAGRDFLIAALGGFLLGYVIGYLSIRFYAWLREAKAQSIFSITIPYVAFILASYLDISAIICVVTAGIFVSRKIPLITTAESRHKAETVWEVFIFAINAFIFTLMGLQFRTILNELRQFSVSELLHYALIVNVVVILVRLIWVYPAAYIPRFLSASLRKRDPYPTWSQLATLGWIGMRGILSLTLVVALPYALPNGEAFPYRSLLIFLTYTVILISLLLPTFTLPLFTKFFKFEQDRENYREEALARIEAAQAVLNRLQQLPKSYADIKDYIEILRQRYQRKIEILESNLKESPFSALNQIEQKIRKLTRELIKTEHNIILELRKKSAIHDEVFHNLERELDLEELRLKTQRI